MTKINIKEEPKDVEAAVETEKVTGKGNQTEICKFVTTLLAIFAVSFAAFFFLYPFIISNPNPHRFVHLNKANGSYGLILDVATITEVIPGGAAALDGHLKKDDEIQSINGVSLRLGPLRAETVNELIEARDQSVDLAVIAKYEGTTSERVVFSVFMGLSMMFLYIGFYMLIGDVMRQQLYKQEEKTKTVDVLNRMQETLEKLGNYDAR